MSVGPLGALPASLAGSPLAQTKGADQDRASQELVNQDRRVQTDLQAERASGIGEADGEDHQPAERDADGRRVLERPARRQGQPEAATESSPAESQRSRDASGQRGTLLDLTG